MIPPSAAANAPTVPEPTVLAGLLSFAQREPLLALIAVLASVAIIGALVEPWLREQWPAVQATAKSLGAAAFSQR